MKITHILAGVILGWAASSVTAQTPQSVFDEAEAFHDKRMNTEALSRYIIIATKENSAPDAMRAVAFYRLSQASVMRGKKIALLDKAARLGSNDARVFLASLIYYEIERDARELKPEQELQSTFSRAYARELLEAAVADEDVDALLDLAGHVRRGELGLLQDPNRAIMLEKKARRLLLSRSNDGDPESMILLARLFARGIGGETDVERSVSWEHRATETYRRMAEDGDIASMRLLFRRYASGDSKLDSKAASHAAEFWARELVKANPVTFDVGWLAFYYKEGRGFPKDLVLAHALYNVDSAMFDSEHSSRQRKEIGRLLTEEERARAFAFARECIDLGLDHCLENDGR